MNEMLVQFFASIGFTQIDGTNFNVTDSPMEKGDVVLGEMNALEKTCLMFLEGKKAEHKELHDQIGELVEVESVEDLAKLAHKHDLLQDTTNVVRGMMWLSVKSRVNHEVGSTGYSLRDGNKIVAVFKEREDEDDMLSKFFGGFGGMIIGMRM